MRYIDAEEFLEGFCIYAIGQDKHFIKAVETVLEDTPTADVVEVVRCKDCKHFMEYTEEYRRNVEGADGDCYLRIVCSNSLNEQLNAVKCDDFCSYGKRKGDT